MKFSKRLVLAGFLFFSVGLVALLFWPFVLAEIIQPTALVLWMLLRIFVLSIDQKYYWGVLIFGVVFFFIRLLPKETGDFQSEHFVEENATLKTIGYWRSLIFLDAQNLREHATLRQELLHLLLSLYATQKRTSADFKLYEALEQGEIPLPPKIRAFLFAEKPRQAGSAVEAFFRNLRNAPRASFRRWSGAEARDHYQELDEVLSFMENTLEMKNDAGKLNPN